MCADQTVGSAHSSIHQADSDWTATLEYLEDGDGRQADSVPPLPEPLQPPYRQVIWHDSFVLTHLPCSTCCDTLPSPICHAEHCYASTSDRMVACAHMVGYGPVVASCSIHSA